jgi:methyl-accepting chemotaxis protein
MKLGFKIAAGFAAILILATLLGGFCTISMKNAQVQSGKLNKEYVPMVSVANDIQKNILLAMLDIRSYALSEDNKYYVTGRAYLEKSKEAVKDATALTDKYSGLKSMKESLGTAETN